MKFPGLADIRAMNWGDLGVRAVSALVLVPAVLLDVWAGGVWFTVFAALLGVLMAHEWVGLAHRGNSAQFALHATAALCGAMLPGTAGIIPALATIAVLTVLSLLLVRQWGADPTLWTGLGVPYVGLPALALVVLRDDANWGLLAILWILFIVWAADTFAYFAGRIIGGPKLAPAISPKKTWAGLGGAMAGAALLSAVIAWFAVPGSIGPLMVLAAVLAVVEQGGDLFESSLKRHFGAKDSGDLIPGHGGAIDRVDGLVAVAVAAALIGFLRGGPLVAQGLLHW